MFSKTNTALLIIALMFIGGCGENLSDYQLRIVKEAESIVSSNNEDGLSAREIKILLTVLYIESVKLKEHNNDGSSYDKLFTTFTHLIPTYQNLVSLENEKQEKNRIESLLKTTDAIISESKLDIKTRIDELEYEVKKLESFKDVLISDAQALYNSLRSTHNNSDARISYMGEIQSRTLC